MLGTVTTIVGQPGVTGFLPGSLPGMLQAPISVAAAPGTHVLYVADRFGILMILH